VLSDASDVVWRLQNARRIFVQGKKDRSGVLVIRVWYCGTEYGSYLLLTLSVNLVGVVTVIVLRVGRPNSQSNQLGVRLEARNVVSTKQILMNFHVHVRLLIL
jgi:hypothetical protein